MTHVIDSVFLKLGSVQYKVILHNFFIRQPERNGRPFGHPKVERFFLHIESDGDDAGLMVWATDSVMTKDGSIDFMSNGALVSQITFTKAYCVGYENEGSYDFTAGKSSIIEKIEVMPTTLNWNDAAYALAA